MPVTEEFGSTEPPDPVETDPAALTSAEDLDEDRLRADPLEAGMDPPEHWSGSDRYGTTPWEQSHARPLEDRLSEEEPDVEPGPERDETDDQPDNPDELDPRGVRQSYDEQTGISADTAGGSMAEEIRTPPEAD